jgi:thioredoxin reductase
VLFASGVEWRRLDVPGVDDLLGAGVYYGAGPSEAPACTGSRVVVVGGGNSAGQAVFAAGDVRCGSVKRCSAAIGEGSMAVALVHRRLAEAGGD